MSGTWQGPQVMESVYLCREREEAEEKEDFCINVSVFKHGTYA